MSKGPFEGFTIRNGWVVPDVDTQCLPWVLNEVPKFEVVKKHLKSNETMIQAGGNIGVFPVLLADSFSEILTFEPDDANFEALKANTAHLPNVFAYNVALGEKNGSAREIVVDRTNIGAHRVEFGSGDIQVVAGDDLDVISKVSLIWLDIEGAELIALRGLVETIKRDKPVIVLEMAGHSKRFYGIDEGETHSWLKSLGYALAERTQQDEIFVHNGT